MQSENSQLKCLRLIPAEMTDAHENAKEVIDGLKSLPLMAPSVNPLRNALEGGMQIASRKALKMLVEAFKQNTYLPIQDRLEAYDCKLGSAPRAMLFALDHGVFDEKYNNLLKSHLISKLDRVLENLSEISNVIPQKRELGNFVVAGTTATGETTVFEMPQIQLQRFAGLEYIFEKSQGEIISVRAVDFDKNQLLDLGRIGMTY